MSKQLLECVSWFFACLFGFFLSWKTKGEWMFPTFHSGNILYSDTLNKIKALEQFDPQVLHTWAKNTPIPSWLGLNAMQIVFPMPTAPKIVMSPSEAIL